MDYWVFAMVGMEVWPMSALMVYALLSVSVLMVAGRWLIRRVLGK